MVNLVFDLPKELVEEIFLFDSTYRDVYRHVLKNPFFEKMRVLRSFLDTQIEQEWNRQWYTIIKKTVCYHRSFDFYEIAMSENSRMVVYVVTLEEKKSFDDPFCIGSPMLLKNCLDLISSQILSNYLEVDSNVINNIQRDIDDHHECNNILYALFTHNGHTSLLQELENEPTHNQQIYQYLFKNTSYSTPHSKNEPDAYGWCSISLFYNEGQGQEEEREKYYIYYSRYI